MPFYSPIIIHLFFSHSHLTYSIVDIYVYPCLPPGHAAPQTVRGRGATAGPGLHGAIHQAAGETHHRRTGTHHNTLYVVKHITDGLVPTDIAIQLNLVDPKSSGPR